MASEHQEFWSHTRYAVVGHTAKRGFPLLTYAALKKRGSQAFAVDPSTDTVDGDRAYPDLASLPGPVEAVVLEVPRDETEAWVARAADAGIREVWIHMNRDTPEALALAAQRGLHVLTGTCAVMYLQEGFSYHSLHGWINRLIGRY